MMSWLASRKGMSRLYMVFSCDALLADAGQRAAAVADQRAAAVADQRAAAVADQPAAVLADQPAAVLADQAAAVLAIHVVVVDQPQHGRHGNAEQKLYRARTQGTVFPLPRGNYHDGCAHHTRQKPAVVTSHFRTPYTVGTLPQCAPGLAGRSIFYLVLSLALEKFRKVDHRPDEEGEVERLGERGGLHI